MKTILISVGEVSGDRFAAHLVHAIRAQYPDCRFVGLGGAHLKAAGVEILDDLTPYGTIGFLEPIVMLPHIFRAYRRLKAFLTNNHVDLFIPVDYQGFHMKVLSLTKSLGIPSVYYIAPQEWQWGTERGILSVVNTGATLLAMFQEEYEVYKAHGADVVMMGHPLLDIVKAGCNRLEFLKSVDLIDAPIIGLFPGTRRQEIKYVAPLLFQAACRIQKAHPDYQFVVSLGHDEFSESLEALARHYGLMASFYQGDSYDVMAYSEFSLSKSGTVTLEHAIMETPCICAYRFHSFSFLLGKKLIGNRWFDKVKYIALPNIISKRLIMPEFLQDAATVDALVDAAYYYISDPTLRDKQRAKFHDFKRLLGGKGSLQRAVAVIASKLQLLTP